MLKYNQTQRSQGKTSYNKIDILGHHIVRPTRILVTELKTKCWLRHIKRVCVYCVEGDGVLFIRIDAREESKVDDSACVYSRRDGAIREGVAVNLRVPWFLHCDRSRNLWIWVAVKL